MTPSASLIELPPSQATALVLAGGQGRRMDGADKGLAPLLGQPLVAHVLRVLAPNVSTILISANRHENEYRRFGRVIADLPERGAAQGPLAGLLAATPHICTPWLVMAACDMPCLPADYVARLYQGLVRDGGDIAFAHAGARDHPVCLLLRTTVLGSLNAYLDTGQRAVMPWLASVRAVRVVFEDANAFLNVNTAQDLARAATLAGQGLA